MSNQYYRLCLNDYSLPGFISGGKDYFGTLEMIGTFITTLKNNERYAESFRELIIAYEKYMSGEKDIRYCVDYQDVLFLVPVELLGENTTMLTEYSWEYLNIWECDYKLKCQKAETFHKWFVCEGEYIRCILARFTDLEYYDILLEKYHKIGNMICGHPGMIVYESPYLFNQLFVIEKTFESKETALEDMKSFRAVNDIVFRQIMNDIFGGG